MLPLERDGVVHEAEGGWKELEDEGTHELSSGLLTEEKQSYIVSLKVAALNALSLIRFTIGEFRCFNECHFFSDPRSCSSGHWVAIFDISLSGDSDEFVSSTSASETYATSRFVDVQAFLEKAVQFFDHLIDEFNVSYLSSPWIGCLLCVLRQKDLGNIGGNRTNWDMLWSRPIGDQLHISRCPDQPTILILH